MARRGSLRASDADREHVAERLRHAATEGRLLTEELEHRLATAFSAKTYAELDPLLADLPDARVTRRRGSSSSLLKPALAAAIAIPVVIAVLAVAVFVLTGLLAAWALWLFVGWWLVGCRRRGFAGGPCGPWAWHASRRRHWHG